MRSTNPVCTSSPEDTSQPLHDFAMIHLLIGANREHGKADNIGVFESPIKGNAPARRYVSKNRQTSQYRLPLGFNHSKAICQLFEELDIGIGFHGSLTFFFGATFTLKIPMVRAFRR